MIRPPVDRLRRLHPLRRLAILAELAKTPGALYDVRFDFERMWARSEQIITPAELRRYALIVAAGPRGCGKTETITYAFNREILAGRAKHPRIFAASEADVDKAVIHGPSGIMATLPPHLRPRWVPSEGPAGVLRYPNGVEVVCFTAKNPEQCVSHQGDLDLYDDVAKWGAHAAKTWVHARVSCRLGTACGLVATTRRGTALLRKLLKGDLAGVLIKRSDDVRANRFNLTPKLFREIAAEIAGDDLARQELDDEDISPDSPFRGLEFEEAPIQIWEAHKSDFEEIVVAIDPADGKGPGHDDWGIGAAGRRPDHHMVALEDLTGQYDDAEAAKVAFDLIERWGASLVIVERNRGEKRITGVLQAEHYRRQWEASRLGGVARVRPIPEIKGVTARQEKRLRAGPLRGLYLQGLIHHLATNMRKLETQQREYDPSAPKAPRQDDRIDWLVHAVTHLAGLDDPSLDPMSQIDGLAERNRQLQARAEEQAAGPGMSPLQKFPNLPDADPRSRGYGRTPWGVSGGGGSGLGGRRIF